MDAAPMPTTEKKELEINMEAVKAAPNLDLFTIEDYSLRLIDLPIESEVLKTVVLEKAGEIIGLQPYADDDYKEDFKKSKTLIKAIVECSKQILPPTELELD